MRSIQFTGTAESDPDNILTFDAKREVEVIYEEEMGRRRRHHDDFDRKSCVKYRMKTEAVRGNVILGGSGTSWLHRGSYPSPAYSFFHCAGVFVETSMRRSDSSAETSKATFATGLPALPRAPPKAPTTFPRSPIPAPLAIPSAPSPASPDFPRAPPAAPPSFPMPPIPAPLAITEAPPASPSRLKVSPPPSPILPRAHIPAPPAISRGHTSQNLQKSFCSFWRDRSSSSLFRGVVSRILITYELDE
ncbi:hypothetical protein RUND412_007214 [Rhizina undulata]